MCALIVLCLTSAIVILLAWDAAVGSCHLLEDKHQDSFENEKFNILLQVESYNNKLQVD